MRDKYGRNAESFGYRNGDLEPYLIEEHVDTGVTYICYSDDASRVIRRIKVVTSGSTTTTTVEAAFGSWSNRAALSYQPVNRELT